MAVLDIVHYGDPILRKRCSKIQGISKLNPIIDDRFDTMYEAEGIGLAANQVGLDINLFMIDVTHTEEAEEPHVFINSKIIKKHGEEGLYKEGCLSIPGIGIDINRPEYVILKYQTLDGKWHENEFNGLLGRAIQHEVDHLNGIFIVDRISEIERMQYNAELKELEENSKSIIKTKLDTKGFVL